MRAPDRSTEQWIDDVKKSRLWTRRAWFTAYDLARELAQGDPIRCATMKPTISRVLNHLLDQNAIERKESRKGNRLTVYWCAPLPSLLYLAWRKTIPPQVYGAPNWPPPACLADDPLDGLDLATYHRQQAAP